MRSYRFVWILGLLLGSACSPAQRGATVTSTLEICDGRPEGRGRVGVLVSGLDDYFAQTAVTTPPGSIGVILEERHGFHRFYVPAPGSGTNVEIIQGSQEIASYERVYFDVELASVESMKRIGIADPYALVSFEVNCGDDAFVSHFFVMTRIERLDATDDYPLKLPEVVALLLSESDRRLEARRGEIDELIRERRAELSLVGEDVEQSNQVIPVLMWQDDHLLARIRTRVIHTEYGDGCPRQTELQCRIPTAELVVEHVVVFTVNRKGDIVDTRQEELAITGGVLPIPR